MSEKNDITMLERIKRLRLQKGYTQEELGKFIGVSRASINKIEKLKDLYLDDLIDKETYKKDYEELNNQLEELSKEDTNKIINIEPLQEFLKLDISIIYDTLNSLEKRRLWVSIIDYIEIGTNKNEIVVHFK